MAAQQTKTLVPIYIWIAFQIQPTLFKSGTLVWVLGGIPSATILTVVLL